MELFPAERCYPYMTKKEFIEKWKTKHPQFHLEEWEKDLDETIEELELENFDLGYRAGWDEGSVTCIE